MSVAETYLAGKDATLTWNGTALNVVDGSYTVDVDVDDMSNNQSGGWEEDVRCLNKAQGSVQAVYSGTTPPPMKSGDLGNLVISVPGGPGISGVARAKNVKKNLTVKGGIKYSFDWKNQGPMTETA
jgi:hypothetical protein